MSNDNFNRLPYQVLMEKHGLTEANLPHGAKAFLKTLKQTLHMIKVKGKVDENGDYIITTETQKKIKSYDKAIVNEIYDYLEDQQRTQPVNPPKQEAPKPEPTPTPAPEVPKQEPVAQQPVAPSPESTPKQEPVQQVPKQEEPKTQPTPSPEPKKGRDSFGKIGFFEF